MTWMDSLMHDIATVAVILCFCMLAVPMPMVPFFFPPFLQLHSYINNHQHELCFLFSVRCCALGAEG